MRRLYDDNLYQFDTPQQSYWEATAGDLEVRAGRLESDESCDVAIIGGGYTGLSAALHLARDYHVDVRVLEAGHIGWGASGRNGGFCCPGGTGVAASDAIRLFGLEQVQDFYRVQREAVELVRQLGDDENIEYQAWGSAELDAAHTPKAWQRLVREHEILTGQLGLDVELLSADAFRERFFDSSEQYGGIVSRPAFGLHPLRYCRGLAAAALRRGAQIHERSRVVNWQKDDDGTHRLSTTGGTLRAKRVLYASNGFIQEDLDERFADITLPVISAIIVTRPLTDDELAAHRWTTDHTAINSRRIMNYFRLLPDRRFLFGGRGHTVGHEQGEQETYANLAAMLRHIWPEWSNAEIDYRWHGLICFTRKLCPAIGQLEDDPSVFFGFGYHGNGVNNASWTGKKLADWIATGSPEGLPDMLLGRGARFPMPRWRTRYLRAGIALSGWLDRFG